MSLPGWRRLVLKSQGAGGRACEGVAFMYSADPNPLLVSGQGWTKAEGEVLCMDLGCGSYKSHREEDPDGRVMWGAFSCPGGQKVQNIWDCLQSEVAGNKHNKGLYLACQGRVTVRTSFVGTQR